MTYHLINYWIYFCIVAARPIRPARRLSQTRTRAIGPGFRREDQSRRSGPGSSILRRVCPRCALRTAAAPATGGSAQRARPAARAGAAPAVAHRPQSPRGRDPRTRPPPFTHAHPRRRLRVRSDRWRRARDNSPVRPPAPPPHGGRATPASLAARHGMSSRGVACVAGAERGVECTLRRRAGSSSPGKPDHSFIR